jgi:hypothetical protein
VISAGKSATAVGTGTLVRASAASSGEVPGITCRAICVRRFWHHPT